MYQRKVWLRPLAMYSGIAYIALLFAALSLSESDSEILGAMWLVSGAFTYPALLGALFQGEFKRLTDKEV